jgi:galactokinase
MNSNNVLIVSSPGRICLFGEHQDYLSLPVIPCAISRRISIKGTANNNSMINLDLPDIGQTMSFNIHEEIKYLEKRDYFRSSINVLKRYGYTFSTGFDCQVKGNIPINSGTSSSSALIVTWLNFLTQMSDQKITLPPGKIAYHAWESEVKEFNEPGGMMDHYSTALGGIIFLKFFPEIEFQKLNADLKTFVLGDSMEPKDTTTILARVKNQVLDVSNNLSKKYNEFSLQTIKLDELKQYKNELTDEQYDLLNGTIRNRDITYEALKTLSANDLDHKLIGKLLNEHQDNLRDIQKISTPKIDRMLKAAMDMGAYGGKINGSGGGGCMFVYAPEDPEKIAGAIEKEGGKAYIINMEEGTRND